MKTNYNIICVIQARMGSRRLPGKSLRLMVGKPMLQLILENIADSEYVDNYIVATSNKVENKGINKLCTNLNVDCFKGSEDDVLSRFIKISDKYNPDFILRLTGDNPFVDNTLIDFIIKKYLKYYIDYDYVNNIENSGFPYGLFVEIINKQAFSKLESNIDKLDREHVTRYFRNNLNKFKVATIKTQQKFKYTNLTVDTMSDFNNAEKIMKSLKRNMKKFTLNDLIVN